MGPAYDKGTSIISGPLDLQLKFPNLLFSRGGHFQASRVSFEGHTVFQSHQMFEVYPLKIQGHLLR